MCLLLPPTRLPGIAFYNPDRTADDVCDALSQLGSAVEIPQRLVRLINEFLDRYTEPDTGIPIFSGGSYFTTMDEEAGTPTPEQEKLEIVDSYATSVVLTTAIISFLRDYRSHVSRRAYAEEIDGVEKAARRRLTAAMVGLLRSFTINVFRSDSREGVALCRTLSQRDDYPPSVVREIRESLRDVIVGLRELPSAGDVVEELEGNPDTLFGCGWSWGVVQGAGSVKTIDMGEFAQPGFAQDAPYLYFTVVAIDGIRDLFGSRARLQGLLDEEQQELARTLNLQWELARRYWSTVARFGSTRWAVEDIAWRTTYDESDYYSVLVTSLVVDSLVATRAPDTDLERVRSILEELADRGRITRRPQRDDPALALHSPGTRLQLNGGEKVAEGAPKLGWLLFEHATLLLYRALDVASWTNDAALRSRTLRLVDQIWQHLDLRRIAEGKATGLWDQPANAFPTLGRRYDVPTWYLTNRVVQCLSTAAEVAAGDAPPGWRLGETAAELLAEAEHVFDREQLLGSAEGGPSLRDSLRRHSTTLDRARRLARTRPGTAVALLSEVLRELDKLSAAREREVGA